ncbi:MAG: tRNA (N6-threonylcarbamoyladenosine(37)-N6)-methyltransferase TrmO [Clostridia bacterium]|nr:tRNA (N6-threonylcarbamoyladenosine(37)-N6)-methyltransferase TrmO [Clostridia bacterium]
MKTIAVIHNEYKEKFGVPRQSGLAGDTVSEIVFEKEYRNEDALRGIEEYSHLWLIWSFSENRDDKWRPTVRPPRLGGNKRVGVFATRSPYRPNAMGLSSVRLLEVKKTEDRGTVLLVSGADLMDGTPILDIKPYVKYTDCHEDAVCSFADEFAEYRLEVSFECEADEKLKAQISKILANDPRPAYQKDENRVYGASICGKEVKFRVGEKITVISVK